MMPEDSPQQGGTGQQREAGKPAAPDGHGGLASLRNIGKAALADFAVLEIQTIGQLARQDADHLYLTLCQKTRQRHDPCVHDVFAAAIHQALTGEARNWWSFTPQRKARQQDGSFPVYSPGL